MSHGSALQFVERHGIVPGFALFPSPAAVDLLILNVVALEPIQGWAVAQRIQQVSGDVLKVNQSALYPALHRLEKQGWVKSAWGASENGRRAKYYSLTKAGAQALGEGTRRLASSLVGHLARHSSGLN